MLYFVNVASADGVATTPLGVCTSELQAILLASVLREAQEAVRGRQTADAAERMTLSVARIYPAPPEVLRVQLDAATGVVTDADPVPLPDYRTVRRAHGARFADVRTRLDEGDFYTAAFLASSPATPPPAVITDTVQLNSGVLRPQPQRRL